MNRCAIRRRMSTELDRRTRKRLALRQSISDAATHLFMERGFDRVTVDEIAEAADVGRMTVFNHFPRKEDMFFDRTEEGLEDLCAALRQRSANIPISETIRLFAHQVIAEQKGYVRFFAGSRRFVEAIEQSETLKARARAIRDELAKSVALAMADTVRRDRADPDAMFSANLLLAVWSVAIVQAHRAYRDHGDAKQAQALFLKLIDKGAVAMAASMAGTPFE